MPGKDVEQNRERISLSSRGLGILIFLPLTIYFRFIGGTWLIHINSYNHSILNLVLISLIFLVWFVWKVHSDKYIPLTGFELPLAAFLLVILLSSIFADNVNMSSEIAVGVIALILSIYIILDIKRSDSLWDSLLNAILIAGAINIILILGRILWWFDLYQIQFADIFIEPLRMIKILPRLPDLRNFNSNVTAAYLLLLLPIIIYKATTAKGWVARYILWLFGFSSLIIIVLTRSRGGYIGLLAGLVVFALLYRNLIFTWYKRKPLLTFLILGGTVIAAIFGAYSVFKSRGNLFSASFLGRIEGWKIALEIIQDNPVLGTGFGGYALRFLALRDPSVYSLLNLHAHNEILNLATNLGLAGLAIFSLIVWKFINKVRVKEEKENGIHRIYLISLAGFIGMGLVDSYFDSSNIALIVIILLVGLLPKEKIRIIPAGAPILGSILIVLICLGAIDLYANWRLFPYEEVRQNVFEGDLTDSMVNIDEAIRRDPDNLFYVLNKAQISGEIDCQKGSTSTPSVRLFEDLLPVYGGWGQINVNVASLYANSKDYDRARFFIQDGIKNDPGKAIQYCLLGDLQILEGLEDKAVSSYSACLLKNANWIDTPYWLADPQKTELMEDIKADMAAKAYLEKNHFLIEYARVLYIAESFEEIRPEVLEILSKAPDTPDLWILYARYLADNGKFSEAEDGLIKVIENDPRNSEAWFVLAGIYLEQNQFEESLHAIDISTALEATPDNLILSGLINSRIGNVQEAFMKFIWALNWMKQPSSLAPWTARRFPVQLEKLSCIPDLLTYRDFYDVAWEGIKELSVHDCEKAESIYAGIRDEIAPGFDEIYGEFPDTCGN